MLRRFRIFHPIPPTVTRPPVLLLSGARDRGAKRNCSSQFDHGADDNGDDNGEDGDDEEQRLLAEARAKSSSSAPRSQQKQQHQLPSRSSMFALNDVDDHDEGDDKADNSGVKTVITRLVLGDDDDEVLVSSSSAAQSVTPPLFRFGALEKQAESESALDEARMLAELLPTTKAAAVQAQEERAIAAAAEGAKRNNNPSTTAAALDDKHNSTSASANDRSVNETPRTSSEQFLRPSLLCLTQPKLLNENEDRETRLAIRTLLFVYFRSKFQRFKS